MTTDDGGGLRDWTANSVRDKAGGVDQLNVSVGPLARVGKLTDASNMGPAG